VVLQESESPLSLGPLSGLASCEVDRASSLFPSDNIASQATDGRRHTDFPSASAIMLSALTWAGNSLFAASPNPGFRVLAQKSRASASFDWVKESIARRKRRRVFDFVFQQQSSESRLSFLHLWMSHSQNHSYHHLRSVPQDYECNFLSGSVHVTGHVVTFLSLRFSGESGERAVIHCPLSASSCPFRESHAGRTP
jgi:hypothetical protein